VRECQRRNEHFLWSHEQRHRLHAPARGYREQQRRFLDCDLHADSRGHPAVIVNSVEYVIAHDQRNADGGSNNDGFFRELERLAHVVRLPVEAV
jgi:hypothetical protein